MSRSRPLLTILSVPFGGGHRAVAEGVRDLLAIEPALSDADLEVVDALDAITRALPLTDLGAALYRGITSPSMRWLYRFLYAFVDRHPEAVGQCCTAIFGRRARRWLREYQPDMIVSTFPLVTYVLGQANRSGHAVPLLSIVTDAGRVNRSWFSGRASAFLVSDDEAHEVGRSCLADDGRLIRTPLPLRAPFHRPRLRHIAHNDWGADARPVVLVWGGGRGMAKRMLAVAEEMHRQQRRLRPIFLTSGNDRLARKLAPLVEGLDGRVLSRCSDVADLLNTVDVVIGKAGWVSLTEAATVGRHTICIDAYPGQELENLRVSIRDGWASWHPDVHDAVLAVERHEAVKPLAQHADQVHIATVVREAMAG